MRRRHACAISSITSKLADDNSCLSDAVKCSGPNQIFLQEKVSSNAAFCLHFNIPVSHGVAVTVNQRWFVIYQIKTYSKLRFCKHEKSALLFQARQSCQCKIPSTVQQPRVSHACTRVMWMYKLITCECDSQGSYYSEIHVSVRDKSKTVKTLVVASSVWLLQQEFSTGNNLLLCCRHSCIRPRPIHYDSCIRPYLYFFSDMDMHVWSYLYHTNFALFWPKYEASIIAQYLTDSTIIQKVRA